ncbi:S8 family peptidase [Clostridium sp. JS66]|uniref:S8 family peptidase n=1 Tax=Clostridium sp. JS66 TaxID=3064705 RepID=UPI00298DC935|nr:S8 family serine peptidase [Clostridium sp. JS66]WPC43335.1 S8 family serine peptidase [Clostridium sp. JS66]
MRKMKIYVVAILIAIFCVNVPVYAKDDVISSISLVILFNDNNINHNVEKYVLESGGEVISQLPEIGGLEVKCSPSLIPKIKKDSSVCSISPSNEIKLNEEKVMKFNDDVRNNVGKYDLYDKYQWDIKKVTNNGKSFSLESGNHNVIVGIIDTGVNGKHADLKANFLGGTNFVPKGFKGDLSEMGDPNDIQDRNGHGTHVAGAIAANGRIKGVAPNIGFKSYRIFNSQLDTTSTIASKAIIKATNDGVKVINLSFGGYDLKGKCFFTDPATNKTYKIGDDVAEYSLYKRAIKYAIDHGVVVVSSAGNEALDCANKKELGDYLNKINSQKGFRYEGIGYEVPGTIKGVITVSATTYNNEIASYSNYGSKFIDIASPGGQLTDIEKFIYTDMCLSTYGDEYAYLVGTSMAAPKVSAVSALIICKYGNIGSKQVCKKIYKSAEKVNGNDSSKYFGHGLVNAYNALSE